MKKHIARMVTALFILAAFAGILTACASEKAVEMQALLDEFIADFTIPADDENPRVEAFQRIENEDMYGKRYNPKQKVNDEGFPLKDDGTVDTAAARREDTFGGRLDGIIDVYNALPDPDKNASGMDRFRRNLEVFNNQVNDYREVSYVVLIVEEKLLDLIARNVKAQEEGDKPLLTMEPIPFPLEDRGQYERMMNAYNGLSTEQKNLYSGCGRAHADKLSAAYTQLLLWDAEIKAAAALLG